MSFMANTSSRSFLGYTVLSLFIHAGAFAGVSLLLNLEKTMDLLPVTMDLLPVTKVSLVSSFSDGQKGPATKSPLPMHKVTRSLVRSSFPPPTPTQITIPRLPSVTTSISPMTPPKTSKVQPTPLYTRTLRDNRAADTLMGTSLMKLATQPPSSSPNFAGSRMMIMTGSAIKSQAPIGKPLNHTFFENELNGPGAHPRPKVLMAGPPGGQGISASTVGLIRRTQPVYPQLAKKSGWQGTVVIRVVVQTNGMPGEAQIRKSSGHDILDKAAIEAIRSWRFSPAKDGNIPIRSAVDIPINFKLHG